MKNIIIIIILVTIGTSLLLTMVYSSEGIGVQAIVPATEFNSNTETLIPAVKKQNKFLFFFEKTLNSEDQPDPVDIADSGYDQYYSYGLLISIMIIVAIFTFIILRLIEKLIIKFKQENN